MIKNHFFTAALILGPFLIQSCAPEPSGPSEQIKNAFGEKFPATENYKWEKEDDTTWEVEFTMGGKEYSASFSNDGKWLETEYEVAVSEIPTKIRAALDNAFANAEIGEIEVEETPKGTFYEVQIEEGEVNHEVLLNSEGEIIEKTSTIDED